jgi:CheY-like chemotaxis protein
MAQQHPCVLVVDDDDDVREMAVTVLEHEGYSVASASNARAALDLIGANPAIRLLFTDIVMPGIDGFVLAHEARKIRPDLRIVYTSGYLKNIPFGHHGIGYGPLIEKPWDMGKLTETMRRTWEAGDC